MSLNRRFRRQSGNFKGPNSSIRAVQSRRSSNSTANGLNQRRASSLPPTDFSQTFASILQGNTSLRSAFSTLSLPYAPLQLSTTVESLIISNLPIIQEPMTEDERKVLHAFISSLKNSSFFEILAYLNSNPAYNSLYNLLCQVVVQIGEKLFHQV